MTVLSRYVTARIPRHEFHDHISHAHYDPNFSANFIYMPYFALSPGERFAYKGMSDLKGKGNIRKECIRDERSWQHVDFDATDQNWIKSKKVNVFKKLENCSQGRHQSDYLMRLSNEQNIKFCFDIKQRSFK